MSTMIHPDLIELKWELHSSGYPTMKRENTPLYRTKSVGQERVIIEFLEIAKAAPYAWVEFRTDGKPVIAFERPPMTEDEYEEYEDEVPLTVDLWLKKLGRYNTIFLTLSLRI